MAGGVTYFDGDGGGSGGSDRSFLQLYRRDSTFLEPLIIGLVSSEHDMGDVFFGSDDAKDMKEIKYKEDILEGYRRKRAIKDLRRKKKGWPCLKKCFEFFKVIFCIKF
ncbi:hypothetical protein P3X46_011555 [Hevea brasiliensis]|uniref:CCT domain-containing protein n=1 Tax=Hevea brasiliensis TaxID=3981 RepID=A0ABQ9M7P4_HEVBR|nr:hypothetical protein P3X46_011555 [Hevea brasiliensis]